MVQGSRWESAVGFGARGMSGAEMVPSPARSLFPSYAPTPPPLTWWANEYRRFATVNRPSSWFLCCLKYSFFLTVRSKLLKTSGVITPTTGESLGSSKVTYLKPGRSDVPAVPHSHGEVAGATRFLGLRGDTSGPCECECRADGNLGKGHPSHGPGFSCGKPAGCPGG